MFIHFSFFFRSCNLLKTMKIFLFVFPSFTHPHMHKRHLHPWPRSEKLAHPRLNSPRSASATNAGKVPLTYEYVCMKACVNVCECGNTWGVMNRRDLTLDPLTCPHKRPPLTQLGYCQPWLPSFIQRAHRKSQNSLYTTLLIIFHPHLRLILLLLLPFAPLLAVLTVSVLDASLERWADWAWALTYLHLQILSGFSFTQFSANNAKNVSMPHCKCHNIFRKNNFHFKLIFFPSCSNIYYLFPEKHVTSEVC